MWDFETREPWERVGLTQITAIRGDVKTAERVAAALREYSARSPPRRLVLSRVSVVRVQYDFSLKKIIIIIIKTSHVSNMFLSVLTNALNATDRNMNVMFIDRRGFRHRFDVMFSLVRVTNPDVLRRTELIRIRNEPHKKR